MKSYTLILLLLGFCFCGFGQNAKDSFGITLSSGSISLMIMDSCMGDSGWFAELGRYNITNDKWEIKDTMGVIRQLYKQTQDQYKVQEWYEKRIDIMYDLFHLEPDLLGNKNNAVAKFEKLVKKLHKLERNRP